MRTKKCYIALTVMVLGLTTMGGARYGSAQPQLELEPYPPVFSDLEGFAIRGTDPVAYFTEKRAVKGDKKITHKWQGATWLFTSAKNRAAFAKEPEKYAPQYGGY